MSPRTTSYVNGWDDVVLTISSSTFDPFSPLKFLNTSSWLTSAPVRTVLSALIILSPARIPTFSAGPPGYHFYDIDRVVDYLE